MRGQASGGVADDRRCEETEEWPGDTQLRPDYHPAQVCRVQRSVSSVLVDLCDLRCIKTIIF